MKLLAIDPAPTKSAWVIWDTITSRPLEFAIEANQDVLACVYSEPVDALACEMVACYGMAVGESVFETALWIGRFIEAAASRGLDWHKVYRKDVKLHLCGSYRAKDANVRQALIDRFGLPGIKKKKGILYGVSKDVWACTAVAVTWADTHC